MLPSFRLIALTFLCGFVVVFAGLRMAVSLNDIHEALPVMAAHAAPVSNSRQPIIAPRRGQSCQDAGDVRSAVCRQHGLADGGQSGVVPQRSSGPSGAAAGDRAAARLVRKERLDRTTRCRRTKSGRKHDAAIEPAQTVEPEPETHCRGNIQPDAPVSAASDALAILGNALAQSAAEPGPQPLQVAAEPQATTPPDPGSERRGSR